MAEELELREWSLEIRAYGSTHRSVAENGFERVDVDDRVEADEEDCAIAGGWGVLLACDALLRTEVDALEMFVEAIARWMAATAAALRAEA